MNMEGIDYIQFLPKKEEIEANQLSAGRPEENHQLKLDMAKEIAMIQRSDAGRKVRKYFIEVEKQYREEKMQLKTANFHIPEYDVRARALMSAGNCTTILNTMLGVHIGIARAHSINNAEKDFNIDLSDIKKLLPPADDVPVTYNPTQLAAKLTNLTGTKYTARKINMMLAELGYQYKNNGEWVLTADGKRYGTSYPYERNGHTGFQILWNEEIINHFKD